MKNIFKILSLVVFVMLMASCQKDSDLLIQQDETENQFKIADNEEIITINNPTIHGQIHVTQEQRDQGISIILICEMFSIQRNTSINEEGYYSFLNILPGTYIQKVKIGEQIISNTTYIVSY